MQNNYGLEIPRVVYSGCDSLDRIKRILNGKKKVAVFTDQGIVNAGLLEEVLQKLWEIGAETILFDEVPTEPTCDEAQSIIDKFKRSQAEYIVAVGGGSVMDIAKLTSIAFSDDYTVRELLDNPLLGEKKVPSLMIPTTAGTGSEATPNSIVAIPEKKLKVGIVNPEMIADAVILNPQMIRSLPRKIAAATGVDALAHAIECFTSKKANLFSDTFSLQALDMIVNNIEEAVDNPEALEAKSQMMIGAFYAGVAITSSGTTAVHALSYPLGGRYHIAHGISNAMLLVPVMKFNEPMCREKFAIAYDRVNHTPDKTFDVVQKSEWIIQKFTEIVKHLDIPVSLKEYGVTEEDLDTLVAAGMEVKRLLANNMREVKTEDAKKMYLQIM